MTVRCKENLPVEPAGCDAGTEPALFRPAVRATKPVRAAVGHHVSGCSRDWTVCELLRLAHKRDLDVRPRQINSTGKSPKTCPAFRAKIFPLTRRANQCSFYGRLTADEGRVAIVTNVR